jgi:hypothetical protein
MGNGIRLGNQVINQFGAPSINENTTGNRPTFGQTGRLFVDTTTNVLQRDTGSAWVDIGAASPTPSLQAVCTVGATYTSDAFFSSVRIGKGGPTANTANTTLGDSSLVSINNVSGNNNTAIGYAALQFTTSGAQNTSLGNFAGRGITSGGTNTCIGSQSGAYNLTTSGGNTFVGVAAGAYSGGSYNTLIGDNVDTQSSVGNLFALGNVMIGRLIGTGITAYHSYNVFIGYNTASGYTGNGVNGLNTVLGAQISLSSQPTVTGAIMFGNNNGIKQQMYSSFNWVLGGGADNGIHQLQLSGGLYCQTLSPSGVTWAVNTTITLGSSNFYYVYTGAGASTITLPTASANNNIYTFINSTNMTYTISTSGGQNILRKNSGTLVTSFTAFSYSSHQLIADGNNKFYEIV